MSVACSTIVPAAEPSVLRTRIESVSEPRMKTRPFATTVF
jgi:hypothetical protein